MVLRPKKTMSSIVSESKSDDVPTEKDGNPKNVQTVDMAESSVLKSPKRGEADLNHTGESHEIKESEIISEIRNMNKSFHAQFSENNARLNENMDAMGKSMNQSLDRCVAQLSENMTTM